MKFTNNPALQDLLAGQYVLGTMRGGARRRFERMLGTDVQLQRRVDAWNEQLAPLAEMVPAVTPPSHVWQGLVQRIPVLAPAPKQAGFWSSLALWRGLAVAMTLIAAVSVALVSQRQQPAVVAVATPAPAVLLATFAAPDTHAPIAVAMMGQTPGQVIIKVVAPNLQIPKDKTLQLWMVTPGSNSMISAGVAPTGLADTMQVPISNLDGLRHAKLLGLSLEPAGGSPQPTHALGFGTWSAVSS